MITGTVLIQSLALGVGLAMDAFSVSLANGMKEPRMPRRRMSGVAGIYAFFQLAMPMIGWVCVINIARTFETFEKLIPCIALILLLYIGGKMIKEGLSNKGEDAGTDNREITFPQLMIQGVATSIDALSVGFAFAKYTWMTALLCAIIIGAVTFVICYVGIIIGKTVGMRLAGKAEVIGGIILILIGIRIFVDGVFL